MVENEILMLNWLRSVSTALVVADVIPDDATYPLIRELMLDNAVSDNTKERWLEKPWFQLDFYGTDKLNTLAIRAQVLTALPTIVGVHPEGVVTGVKVGTDRSMPDVGFSPPRPRQIVTVTLYTHP